ncbi:MAG: hypothetical protein ACQEP4_05650 [Bacillota bacterium]
MNFVKSDTFKKYFIPGIIFQSVVIAGGYGTGREIVEFFLSFGTVIGLIAQGYGTITWGFLIFYVIPIVTIGVYKIIKATSTDRVGAEAAE